MKQYDVRINSSNSAEPMTRGFFERMNRLSMAKWNDDDYIVGISEKGVEFRFCKKAINHDTIQKFIRRNGIAFKEEEE